MAQRMLAESPYFRLLTDDSVDVVRLERTAARFPSVEALRAAVHEVAQVTSTLSRGMGLLIDARSAPARNDAEFEEEFARARRPVLAHFRRVAVLVRSAAGRLQVMRYAREDQVAGQLVFDDEIAALEYLAERAR